VWKPKSVAKPGLGFPVEGSTPDQGAERDYFRASSTGVAGYFGLLAELSFGKATAAALRAGLSQTTKIFVKDSPVLDHLP